MAEHVTYFGHIIPWDGYGLSTCIFFKHFHDRATLSYFGRGADMDLAFLKFPEIVEACTRPVPQSKWHIDHTPPIIHGDLSGPFRKSERKVIATMWELHKIPSYWKPIIDRYDKIVVPDTAQVDIFVRSGVNPSKITVIPEFIDVDFWSQEKQNPPDDGIFRFFTWGVLSNRKCPTEIIKAFKIAFGKQTDVALCLKTIHGAFDADIGDDERITLIDATLEDFELRQLVAYHDCVISVSRGEGYGCCPIQAMALGKPVILNGAFSLKTKWDNRYNYPIDDNGLEPCEPSVAFPEPDGGLWCKINVNFLADRMREIYENRDEARRKGKLAALEVKKYGVDRVVKQWQSFLESLD